MDKRLTTRLFNSRLMKSLGFELKRDGRPDYGRNPVRFDPWPSSWWRRDRWDTNVDYKREVGSLDGSSLVMAVITVTGMQLSEAVPVVMLPDEKGFEQPDWAHECASLIRRPNPFHTWGNYTLALALSYWIDGNVYFKKVHDLGGGVSEFWYLPHHLVEPRWPGDGGTPEVPKSGKNKAENEFISHYQFSIPGETPELIHARDVIHYKRGSNIYNPRKGVGAFESVVKEIYGDQKAALFTATILKNLGIVVPLISPKNPEDTVSPEQAAHIKERWIRETTGDNAGVPMINPVALDVTKMSFSPQELDLKELRLIPESRIAAVTGIPAPVLQFMVGLQNGTSYASYEQARRQCYESVIIPIQKQIAEILTWQLLPEVDDTKGARVHFDTSLVSVLQENQNDVMKRAAVGYQAGILKRSDAREWLGLDSTPEDEFYKSEGAMTLAEEPDPDTIEKYIDYLDNELKEFK